MTGLSYPCGVSLLRFSFADYTYFFCLHRCVVTDWAHHPLPHSSGQIQFCSCLSAHLYWVPLHFSPALHLPNPRFHFWKCQFLRCHMGTIIMPVSWARGRIKCTGEKLLQSVSGSFLGPTFSYPQVVCCGSKVADRRHHWMGLSGVRILI